MADPEDPSKPFDVGGAGRRLEELADSDSAYLYWLARHPSGVRYRAEIARVLGAKMQPKED